MSEAVDDPAGFVDPRFGEYLANSLAVAAIAATGCVLLSLLMSHAIRIGGGRVVRTAAQLTTFGYAVPGAVIGIGVLLTFAAADAALERAGVPGGTGLLVTGSVLGILYAYLVRFLAPAYQAVDASFSKIAPSMTLSAMSLGAGPMKVLRRVHLPLVRPGVAVALVLVTHRRDQGAAHRAAAAALRVHYGVRVGLPARRRELLGEGCAAGTRHRRRGRGPGVLPLPADPGHRPASAPRRERELR